MWRVHIVEVYFLVLLLLYFSVWYYCDSRFCDCIYYKTFPKFQTTSQFFLNKRIERLKWNNKENSNTQINLKRNEREKIMPWKLSALTNHHIIFTLVVVFNSSYSIFSFSLALLTLIKWCCCGVCLCSGVNFFCFIKCHSINVFLFLLLRLIVMVIAFIFIIHYLYACWWISYK